MGKDSSTLAKGYLDRLLNDSPTTATFLGFHDRDSKMGDFSAAFFDRRKSYVAEFLSEVKGELPGTTDKAERVSLEVLKSSAARELISLENIRDQERDPGFYPQACLSGLHLLLARDYAPLTERLQSAASRLGKIPEVLDHGKQNINNPPKLFAETALETARAGTAFLNAAVPAAAKAAGIDPSLVEQTVSPAARAFDSYAKSLENLIPSASGSFPVGRELYERLLDEVYFLDFDSMELTSMGEDELIRLDKELTQVAREISPGSSWVDILDRLKDEHPEPDRIRQTYQDEMEKAKDFIKGSGLVDMPDGEKLTVIDTPVFARPTLPYAAYLPAGPFEKFKEGLFYVTPVNPEYPEEMQRGQLRGHSIYKIPITAIHEGYPGHHLQLFIAGRNTSLPRKLAFDTVFIEGWALYCEQMMWEVGYLTDPRIKLLQLKDAVWRAARVVVDTRLQRGEMSYDEAVDFMVNNAHLERVNAESEVKRYAGDPVQPSSYMIGMHAILRLRKSEEERLGDKFELSDFHNRLLSVGSIAPSLITKYGLEEI
jgi:uncharacterized protein (DUF885 family)